MAWLALYLYVVGALTIAAVLDNDLDWIAIVVWPVIAPITLIASLFKESA